MQAFGILDIREYICMELGAIHTFYSMVSKKAPHESVRG